jgi:hypothetical protein
VGSKLRIDKGQQTRRVLEGREESADKKSIRRKRRVSRQEEYQKEEKGQQTRRVSEGREGSADKKSIRRKRRVSRQEEY